MCIKKLYLLLPAVWLLASGLHAEMVPISPEEEEIASILDDASELLASSWDEAEMATLLDDATKVVTDSRLNVDYTPSVVSVLEHDQLRSLGLKTLFEALSILPGVETSISQLGIKKVIVRGFDNPNNFTFDKIKLIIDGVGIEMGIFENTSFYLNLPTDLIERIEVLRGPGSALYGNGAFNGVINVITRRNADAGNGLFFSAGSYSYLLGGLRQHYLLGTDTVLHADLYYQKNRKMLGLGDEFEVMNIVDRDLGPVPFGRDTESNEVLDDYSFGIFLAHKAWSFKARLKEEKSGNYFGWDEALEIGTDHRHTQRYLFAQVEYADRITKEIALNARLGYSHYSLDMDGQNYVQQSGVNIPFFYSVDEKEQMFDFETFVTSSAIDRHTLTAGAELKTMQEIENSIDDDISPYGKRALFEEGVERNSVALYARDTVELGEDLSALIALRFDYYEKERRTYPSAQAGLVYNASPNWNFKLNYGHAFRVPSWVEQYSVQYGTDDGTRPGNSDLVAETTDTFEAVAIYRYGQMHHLQCNLYYSLMDDVLDIEDATDEGGYANQPRRTSAGLEAAYTLLPYKQDRLHLNFTYNKTTYKTPIHGIDQTMPGVAQVMAKGYYIHYLTPSVSLSALVKYIGERARDEDFDDKEYNDDLDPYTTVDLTANFVTGHHWDIHASVKNLFDADVRYPSYYNRHNDGLPREGVNYLVQAEYAF
jgi:outer membrane receptor for ferrienterochelin and colicins